MPNEEIIEEEVKEVSPAAEPETTSTDVNEGNAEPSNTEGTIGSSDEKVVTEKKDYTELEKAQYSFHKQFTKQRKRFEDELNKRNEEYKALQERLERLENPDKYREKYRSDFETDDEYINHLVEARLSTMLEQREKEAAEKVKAENEKLEAAKAETERINNNIRACFGTDEAIKDYQEKVGIAFEAGLEELIDNTPELSNYIQRSTNGPKILYKLATDANSVKQIFDGAIDNYDIAFRVRDLEKSILAEEQKLQTQAQVVNEVKEKEPVVESIGTPGKSTGKSHTSVFDSDKALRDFMNS